MAKAGLESFARQRSAISLGPTWLKSQRTLALRSANTSAKDPYRPEEQREETHISMAIGG